MLKEIIKVKNGDHLVDYYIYSCDSCNCDIEEAWPRYEDENKILCLDCAFMANLISEEFYLRFVGMCTKNTRCGINPETNKIEIYVDRKKLPWELSDKEQRFTPEYNQWRISVLERDKYTCQHCGQIGGRLEAHHIKNYKDFKKLRTDIDNGITLCKKCHKKTHKKTKISR